MNKYWSDIFSHICANLNWLSVPAAFPAGLKQTKGNPSCTICTSKEKRCVYPFLRESIDTKREWRGRGEREEETERYPCEFDAVFSPWVSGAIWQFSGICFSRLWFWMMLTVMFSKFLLILMNKRVTAGCILLTKRSFREQTSCSQFSRGGDGDRRPIWY